MADHRPMLRPPPRKPKLVLHDGPPPTTLPVWPSYTGTSEYVGTSQSGRVAVYVDPSLGDPALQNAQDLLADADRIVSVNDGLFSTSSGSVNVIVFALGGATDGTGGADHMGCDYTTGGNIEVCASFGQSARVSALFEAELSECAMGNNLCGQSTGEALSRWCSMVASGNALSDFTSAPTWAQDGMPNFVDTVDQTDQNYDSIGCGMAFLSWLQSLGSTLDKIAQTMVSLGDGGTLAGAYQALTGDAPSNAWPKFKTAIDALEFGVTTDDPFAGVSSPQPTPPPTPAPPPNPGEPVTLAMAQSWASAGIATGDPLQTILTAQQLASAGLAQNWPAT
jgi:hypothetical protein